MINEHYPNLQWSLKTRFRESSKTLNEVLNEVFQKKSYIMLLIKIEGETERPTNSIFLYSSTKSSEKVTRSFTRSLHEVCLLKSGQMMSDFFISTFYKVCGSYTFTSTNSFSLSRNLYSIFIVWNNSFTLSNTSCGLKFAHE